MNNKKNKKSEEDFLLDIETDIDKDWGEISKELSEKEKVKKLEEIYEIYERERMQRPSFPSFDSFHLELFKILKSLDDSNGKDIDYSSLHNLLRGLFYRYMDIHSDYEERLPEGFKTLWQIMCDPRNFKHDNTQCKFCNKKYNIFYTQPVRIRMPRFERYDSDFFEIKDISYKSTYCPNCGATLRRYADLKPVCVFEVTSDEGEEEEYARKKFRNYF